MRPLTHSEKRTVRLGAIAVGAYLVLFGGMQTARFFERKRSDYQKLVHEAQGLKREIQIYDDKAVALKKIIENFNLDPARLSRTTVVAEASAAIQKTAAATGVQVGAVRESPARAMSKELGTIQMETIGPVPAIMALLGRFESVGYPLIVDSLQIAAEPTRPGQIKMSLTILVLDFDQWKKGGTPNG
jgi:hypothetical protein